MGRPLTPPCTVDLIVALPGNRLVLVRRAHEPIGWALPGGFVDLGETLGTAAKREALEEIGLRVELLEQFYSYSDPARDPRGQTISTVFLARADDDPVGGDDAAEARAFPLDSLPESLCFDHARILGDYHHYLATGVRPKPE